MLIGSHVRASAMTRANFRGGGLFVHDVTPWWQGRTINRLLGEEEWNDRKSAIPSGYLAPSAWALPITSGGLSSYRQIAGEGDIDANGAMGLNAAGTLAGSGDLAATGALIVSAIAALTGSGALSGNVVAVLAAAATLAGSGDLAGAATAIGHAIAALEGEGALTLTSYATGELAASITPFTDLSPQSLAAAVWSSAEGAFLYAVAHNKVITDPAAGTYTVYDEDDTTVLYTADLWADAAGTTPYSGSGAERRDRLT